MKSSEIERIVIEREDFGASAWVYGPTTNPTEGRYKLKSKSLIENKKPWPEICVAVLRALGVKEK